MHDCWQCGSACYCHGDIDDCQVETIEYAYDHCEGCGCEEDPHEFDEDEDRAENEAMYDEAMYDEDWYDMLCEGNDFDEWREEYIQPCVMHRNVHCSRCHA